MKFLLCLTLATLVAVAQAQFVQYGPWSTCDSTCTQTRSVTGCFPPAGPGCALAPLLGMLTCQSCVNATAGCGASSIPTNWQGIYTVRANRCNAAGSSSDSACCCMPSGANVYVRQYDELVEMTFEAGVTMSGPGCNLATASSAAFGIPTSIRFSPRGVSFKVVDPRAQVGPVFVNAGTYTQGALAKTSFTGSTIAGTNVPDTIGTAGAVTLFGRTFRAIRTCNSIYIFGLNGFTTTDNPLCVHQLDKIADLASY